MLRIQIETIEIGIGRALFDDKDLLPELQQLVKRRRRQIVETLPLSGDPGSNLWQAVQRLRAGKAVAMQPQDYGPFPYVPIKDR